MKGSIEVFQYSVDCFFSSSFPYQTAWQLNMTYVSELDSLDTYTLLA